MPNTYSVTQEMLAEISARLAAGTATAQELAYIAAGIAKLTSADDFETIVAGILDTSKTTLDAANTTFSTNSAVLTRIDNRLAAGTYATRVAALPAVMAPTYAGATEARALIPPNTATNDYANGRQSRSWLVDRRSGRNRTFVTNHYTTSANAKRTGFGYIDEGNNYQSLDDAVNVDTAQDAFMFWLPLRNSANTAVFPCLFTFPTSTGSAVTIRRVDITASMSVSSYSWLPGGYASAFRQKLVYDKTNKCLIAHDDTNFIRVFADGTSVLTGGSFVVGAWSAANWYTALNDATLYYDLSGDIEAHANRADGKYLLRFHMPHWNDLQYNGATDGTFYNSSIHTGLLYDNAYWLLMTESSSYRTNPRTITNYISPPPPHQNVTSMTVPFCVINSDSTFEFWRCSWTPDIDWRLYDGYYLPSFTGNTLDRRDNMFPYLKGFFVNAVDESGITRSQVYLPLALSPTTYGDAGTTVGSYQYAAINGCQVLGFNPYTGQAVARARSASRYSAAASYVTRVNGGIYKF